MAYNYGPPPGAYGARHPAYGPPGGMNHSMAPPPTFAAPPGMDMPPGMQPPAMSPAGMQGQFQAPPNMPNINFNAPVIRLGLDAQSDRAMGGDRGSRDGRGSNAEPMGNRNRMGLGADPAQSRNLDRERQQVRESMMALNPLTREEVARTIFIGGLVPGVPSDERLESILRCAGKLRRWTRGHDADDKKCKFGFAEYEDVDSLEAASEIFPGLEVPMYDASGAVQKAEGTEGEVRMTQLLVVVDEQSKKYIEDWKGRSREDDSTRQFRIDGCKEDLRQTVANFTSNDPAANGFHAYSNGVDANGDVVMGNANGDQNGDGAEVVTIPVALEDELADIPADMRATVAEEIKAFRDRSIRRDLERLKREEELEQEERKRSNAQSRNGVPLGPRGGAPQGVQGAPSGPKGFRGAQLPNDYTNGVAFVPGAGQISLNREDDDAEESDEELERRRQEKKAADLEKQYSDMLSRWQKKERTRAQAQERERNREAREQKIKSDEREHILEDLMKWNDEKEAHNRRELYYADPSAWRRRRQVARENEEREDERDRQAEQRENAEERKREDEARGMADNFLDSMGIGAAPPKPNEASSGFGGFKINLGNASGTKNALSSAPKRAANTEIEDLLEDDADATDSGINRPAFKPLTDTSTVPLSGEDLTDAEKREARQELAAEMQQKAKDIFSYPIKWASVTSRITNDTFRPYIERKVMEHVGLVEEVIVELLMDGIKDRKNPRDLIKELEPALEDEAESLVLTVWRLVALVTEVEARGLSADKR